MKKSYKILSFLFIFLLTLNTTKAFSDIPGDSWYGAYVQNLVSAGIVDEAGKFRPGDKLKRAELMKMDLAEWTVVDLRLGLCNRAVNSNRIVSHSFGQRQAVY